MKNQLMTKAILAKLPKLYATQDIPVEKKVCICKFFTPWSNWSWYVVEGSPYNDGDIEFFGRVDGHESEWGYFTLHQLQDVRGPGGLKIERDLHFNGPIPAAPR